MPAITNNCNQIYVINNNSQLPNVRGNVQPNNAAANLQSMATGVRMKSTVNEGLHTVTQHTLEFNSNSGASSQFETNFIGLLNKSQNVNVDNFLRNLGVNDNEIIQNFKYALSQPQVVQNLLSLLNNTINVGDQQQALNFVQLASDFGKASSRAVSTQDVKLNLVTNYGDDRAGVTFVDSNNQRTQGVFDQKIKYVADYNFTKTNNDLTVQENVTSIQVNNQNVLNNQNLNNVQNGVQVQTLANINGGIIQKNNNNDPHILENAPSNATPINIQNNDSNFVLYNTRGIENQLAALRTQKPNMTQQNYQQGLNAIMTQLNMVINPRDTIEQREAKVNELLHKINVNNAY